MLTGDAHEVNPVPYDNHSRAVYRLSPNRESRAAICTQFETGFLAIAGKI